MAHTSREAQGMSRTPRLLCRAELGSSAQTRYVASIFVPPAHLCARVFVYACCHCPLHIARVGRRLSAWAAVSAVSAVSGRLPPFPSVPAAQPVTPLVTPEIAGSTFLDLIPRAARAFEGWTVVVSI